MKKLILIAMLSMFFITCYAQKYSYPSYLSLKGLDSIHTSKFVLVVGKDNISIDLAGKEKKFRIVECATFGTNHRTTIYKLSCGAKLEICHTGEFEFCTSIYFRSRKKSIYTGPAFCRAVILKRYKNVQKQ